MFSVKKLLGDWDEISPAASSDNGGSLTGFHVPWSVLFVKSAADDKSRANSGKLAHRRKQKQSSFS